MERKRRNRNPDVKLIFPEDGDKKFPRSFIQYLSERSLELTGPGSPVVASVFALLLVLCVACCVLQEAHESISDLGEVLVSLLYNENLHRLSVTVIEARRLKVSRLYYRVFQQPLWSRVRDLACVEFLPLCLAAPSELLSRPYMLSQ
jgi:hypothetical protein